MVRLTIDGVLEWMKYSYSFTEEKKKHHYKSKQITRWIHISETLKKKTKPRNNLDFVCSRKARICVDWV